MRKPAFHICENKDTDQLCGNRQADQRLCFRYIDSTIPLLLKSEKFKPPSIFCRCTAWFVSDQVGNQNVGFLTTRLISICNKHSSYQFVVQVFINNEVSLSTLLTQIFDNPKT